jgi:hypothetical protein
MEWGPRHDGGWIRHDTALEALPMHHRLVDVLRQLRSDLVRTQRSIVHAVMRGRDGAGGFLALQSRLMEIEWGHDLIPRRPSRGDPRCAISCRR